jgi:hypothetical protein
LDDEDSTITAGSIVTVTVTLERRNMEELFEQEITEKLPPEMEKEEVEEITANVSKTSFVQIYTLLDL